MNVLRMGHVLYGFCGGYFGRDSYHDKVVEAIGHDWVVARRYASPDAEPEFFTGDPQWLTPYTTPEEEEPWS